MGFFNPFKRMVKNKSFLHDLRFHDSGGEEALLEDLKQIVQSQHLGEHFRIVRNFEKQFARHFGHKHAMGTSSGTSALYSALRALGIGKGHEVITVANTFVSTITSVLETGATCRFVDIDEKTGLMDPLCLEQARTPQTKAIIPVHMYGHMVAMDQISEFADAHGLVVIEDACQAIGCSFLGKSAGQWGNIGCFSFHATKLVGGPGDGGMVVTDDPKVNKTLREQAKPQWDQIFESDPARFPNRLSPILIPFYQARIKDLGHNIQLREQQFQQYKEGLMPAKSIQIIDAPEGGTASRRNFVLVSEDVESIRQALKANAILVDPLYEGSKKLLNALSKRGVDLPKTQYFVDHHLCLPIGPHVSQKLIDSTVQIIKKGVHG